MKCKIYFFVRWQSPDPDPDPDPELDPDQQTKILDICNFVCMARYGFDWRAIYSKEGQGYSSMKSLTSSSPSPNQAPPPKT
jgi:hypothetical protein